MLSVALCEALGHSVRLSVALWEALGCYRWISLALGEALACYGKLPAEAEADTDAEAGAEAWMEQTGCFVSPKTTKTVTQFWSHWVAPLKCSLCLAPKNRLDIFQHFKPGRANWSHISIIGCRFGGPSCGFKSSEKLLAKKTQSHPKKFWSIRFVKQFSTPRPAQELVLQRPWLTP